jgi:hypothetical protein
VRAAFDRNCRLNWRAAQAFRIWFEAQQPWWIWKHGLRIWLREALATQEVEEDLRVTPSHIGVALTLSRLITEIAPTIDHLLGRSPADTELKASARDQIGCARVLSYVERVLVAHIDHRRADFDAADLRTDGRQQRKWRGKLACEVMDSEIGSVRAQFLGGNGQVDGLQERVRGRAGP